MDTADDFNRLVDEAEAADVTGWGFSWLAGRATEERPPWGYARLLADRLAAATRACDLDTGGGEVLSEALGEPSRVARSVAATEAYRPNALQAARRLAGRVSILEASTDQLPFRAGSFDLLVSRHPVDTSWPEIARVLSPGGSYLAQHVGPGSNRELTEFFLGRQQGRSRRDPALAAAEAGAAGLAVSRLETATLQVVFYDVGAIVWFLRKVVWTVPGFSVERYRDRLLDLHRLIQADGEFVAHSTRFLIEATRTG